MTADSGFPMTQPNVPPPHRPDNWIACPCGCGGRVLDESISSPSEADASFDRLASIIDEEPTEAGESAGGVNPTHECSHGQDTFRVALAGGEGEYYHRNDNTRCFGYQFPKGESRDCTSLPSSPDSASSSREGEEDGNVSDDELRAIEWLANAATRGPWTAFITEHVIAINAAKQDLIHWAGFDQSYASKRKSGANAEFIAHARTDVPRLIATVRSIRQQLAAAERERDAALSFAAKQGEALFNRAETAERRSEAWQHEYEHQLLDDVNAECDAAYAAAETAERLLAAADLRGKEVAKQHADFVEGVADALRLTGDDKEDAENWPFENLLPAVCDAYNRAETAEREAEHFREMTNIVAEKCDKAMDRAEAAERRVEELGSQVEYWKRNTDATEDALAEETARLDWLFASLHDGDIAKRIEHVHDAYVMLPDGIDFRAAIDAARSVPNAARSAPSVTEVDANGHLWGLHGCAYCGVLSHDPHSTLRCTASSPALTVTEQPPRSDAHLWGTDADKVERQLERCRAGRPVKQWYPDMPLERRHDDDGSRCEHGIESEAHDGA
jgi:hypothetical protein